MRLTAKVIRLSRAKFHCNRLTTVQDIQHYASLICWDTSYTVSKKTAFLFLSVFRQISTNFNKFW